MKTALGGNKEVWLNTNFYAVDSFFFCPVLIFGLYDREENFVTNLIRTQ